MPADTCAKVCETCILETVIHVSILYWYTVAHGCNSLQGADPEKLFAVPVESKHSKVYVSGWFPCVFFV